MTARPTIQVRVSGTGKAIERLTMIGKRAEDLRPVFEWARRELETANRRNFNTRGAASGRPWMPLDDEYARWKLAHHGPRPVMEATGALRRSLTFLRGTPNFIGRTRATFGTNIEYAKFHQTGTRKMAQRKIVFVPKTFARELSQQSLNHVLYGRNPIRVATGTLRSALTS